MWLVFQLKYKEDLKKYISEIDLKLDSGSSSCYTVVGSKLLFFPKYQLIRAME